MALMGWVNPVKIFRETSRTKRHHSQDRSQTEEMSSEITKEKKLKIRVGDAGTCLIKADYEFGLGCLQFRRPNWILGPPRPKPRLHVILCVSPWRRPTPHGTRTSAVSFFSVLWFRRRRRSRS